MSDCRDRMSLVFQLLNNLYLFKMSLNVFFVCLGGYWLDATPKFIQITWKQRNFQPNPKLRSHTRQTMQQHPTFPNPNNTNTYTTTYDANSTNNNTRKAKQPTQANMQILPCFNSTARRRLKVSTSPRNGHGRCVVQWLLSQRKNAKGRDKNKKGRKNN